MDIAKIRKKAREKGQGEAAGKPPETPPVVHEEEREEERAAPPTPTPREPAAGKKEEKETKVPQTPPGAGQTGGEVSGAAPAEEGREEEETAETAGDILELLTFRLSREEFAFQVSEVEEIVRHQSITKVPSLPAYVLGITSLRGKIIPVIDLKKRLALSDTASDDVVPRGEMQGDGNKKILIIAGPKGLIGVTIDKVMGVVRLAAEKLLEPPAHLTEEELKCIDGVVILEKRFISTIRAEDALNIEGG